MSVTATFAGLSDEAALVVTPPRLDRITIVEGDTLATPGTTRQYTARGHFSDGSFGSIAGTLVWSTGHSTIAVDHRGEVRHPVDVDKHRAAAIGKTTDVAMRFSHHMGMQTHAT
jgi:hypothetical protein